MSKKSENFFFNNFVESASASCEAAEMLKTALADFNFETLPDKLDELHEIEHKGDSLKHKMTSELVRAFITPIERDDINALSQNIDDVTDAVEDVLIHIYINNITELRQDSFKFADLLIDCCNTMKEMLQEFSNFKKSKKLEKLIIEINHLEEEGDKMYVESMRNLHTTVKDPLQIFTWSEIYGYFEKCCDECEDVADIVESIAIGNS